MAFRQCLRMIRKNMISTVIGASIFTSFNEKTEFPKSDNKLKFEPINIEKLSFDYMIKQSTIDSVNSATQVITVTYSAIESTCNEYRQILSSLMHLMEDTQLYEVSDEHRDTMIALRSELQTKKKLLNQLIGYMENAQRMAESVTSLGYLSGMDSLSISLCERIDDAVRHKDHQLQENIKLEKQYYLLEEQIIKNEAHTVPEKLENNNNVDVNDD
ncbi:hypothetical protein HCN44_001751 [Aphidius gifuensis]|uniref:Diablo homolog, mitochondrial n=1 Tax=Aphidius gifuensis TaxID=684658 RepID=A0A834XTB1_APHGI|nr:uncharacterized protein LOC122853061 [Aphidius gifuensis]KAF7992426.1 hypothetical protein HCN44_001751 [Aphidius gifuensis]